MSFSSKKVVVDPGHGGSEGQDKFRIGPSGEREEDINLRVSLFLKEALEKKGIQVFLTRDQDEDVPLSDRVALAVKERVDLFISVHHASCDPPNALVNFPFAYMHRSWQTSPEKNLLAQLFLDHMKDHKLSKPRVYSDLWVFDNGIFVLRELEKYEVPSILTECSFFSHPEEEKWLQRPENNRAEANRLCELVVSFFTKKENLNQQKQALLKEDQFDRRYFVDLLRLKDSKVNFSEALDQGRELFKAKQYSEALQQFELALAQNVYFPEIKETLSMMLECGREVGSEEKSRAFRSFQASVF